jgi:hypothetical protein
VGVQGESDRQRELLDMESVAGHLLEPGSVFALLAEHRDRLFPATLFADLFPSGRGRPSIPGEVIASVIVLQALYGHSDREAVDALTFDLRWKAACGYAIDAKGFDPSTLTSWRRRLAASDRPQRIFEVVREVITESGAVAGKQRRALDSTVLDDAVARQDTITQLVAQIRRVGREVPGAKQLIAAHCTRLAALTGQDYDQSGKPPIAWDDPAARATSWSRRWSVTRWPCSLPSTSTRSPGRAGSRPRQSHCWRWSPGKTSSRPRTLMAPTAGGASRG